MDRRKSRDGGGLVELPYRLAHGVIAIIGILMALLLLGSQWIFNEVKHRRLKFLLYRANER